MISQPGLLRNARDLASSPPGCRSSGSSSSTIFLPGRRSLNIGNRPQAHRPSVPQRHTSAPGFDCNQHVAFLTSGTAMSRTTRPSTAAANRYRSSLPSSNPFTHVLVLTIVTKGTSGAFCSGQRCIAVRSSRRRSPSEVEARPSFSARLQAGVRSALSRLTIFWVR